MRGYGVVGMGRDTMTIKVNMRSGLSRQRLERLLARGWEVAAHTPPKSALSWGNKTHDVFVLRRTKAR